MQKKTEKMSLKEACAKYKLNYREGVTRFVDLAKALGVNYEDGYSLEDIINQYENR
jgi:hypothetical protein